MKGGLSNGWKPVLCHEQEISFYDVKPLKLWNLFVRVASIIIMWFHMIFSVNTLNSEEREITVGLSKLKASFKDEVRMETHRAKTITMWGDLHKQRYQGRRVNNTEKAVST